jgi:acetylornithine deacetylase/succinyl-diaminopimelate desuccinylase-like protein
MVYDIQFASRKPDLIAESLRLLMAGSALAISTVIATVFPNICQAATTQTIDPAIAALVAQVSPARLKADDLKLVGFGTRSAFSETGQPPGRGVFAARDWIAAQFRDIAAQSGGRMSVALDGYVQTADGKRMPRDVEISSVVATLKGDEPGVRTYVMSSHYDSRNSNNDDAAKDAPGADDNGSGTVAVIEAARILARAPLRATVIFATYDSEEQGLFGSKHHADGLKAAGVDVQGDLNNDIIGASVGDKGQSTPGRVRIFSEALAAGADPAKIDHSGGESDSPSRELARFARAAGDRYVPGLTGDLIFRADRFLRGGDQESFTDAGYPAIRFVEPVETFAHQHQDVRVENGVQYGDLPEFVDFDYVARVTQYNIAVLASLAGGPGRPVNAAILTRDLTNDTTLSWSPVPGAARYEILRRKTTEPDWTDSTDAGVATTITLPFSKDDWLFAIRAVDAAGHEGVAAFPTPVR